MVLKHDFSALAGHDRVSGGSGGRLAKTLGQPGSRQLAPAFDPAAGSQHWVAV